MAEGFARAYGSDVMVPASAGLAPAMRLGVPPNTLRAMDEKNIDLRQHFPKGFKHLGRAEFDLVVNMSGMALPEAVAAPVREWDVPDPVLLTYPEHCEVRDHIERLVKALISELRQQQQAGQWGGLGWREPV
jgi:arsenate reductase